MTITAITEIDPGLDSRHVFLDARDVMARYGRGKTKGYQNFKDRDLVPPPVMTHPDRWRLDQLLMWEDNRIASATAEAVPRLHPEVTDPLPPAKRARRKSV